MLAKWTPAKKMLSKICQPNDADQKDTSEKVADQKLPAKKKNR